MNRLPAHPLAAALLLAALAGCAPASLEPGAPHAAPATPAPTDAAVRAAACRDSAEAALLRRSGGPPETLAAEREHQVELRRLVRRCAEAGAAAHR